MESTTALTAAPATPAAAVSRAGTARRFATLAAGPLAILIAGGIVWQGSQAAFTSTTRNSGNSWSTGNVALTDDDRGSARFSVENLVPGQTGQKCLVVTSNSTVPGVVKLFQANLTESGQGLDSRIKLSIEEGSGGSFNDCTGFVASGPAPAFVALDQIPAVDYSTGIHAWTTTGTVGETRSYRANWTFDTTGMTQAQVDALQGATVHADIVWEFQSTPAQS
jgi:hypothetical protein